MGDRLRRGGRLLWLGTQIAILSALVLTTRCANFRDVFVGGKIYFVDADCYSRMTRARMIEEHPGTIVRQENFENYPAGVRSHATAPLDYLIVGLAAVLSSLTAQPLDLAGAIISPLLALLGGWFLWWWSRKSGFRYRWAALLLFALSPILAHGTALGRPDHQSLLMMLLLVALAAEWTLLRLPSTAWSVVSGLSWGLALWVSLYEPLVLLVALGLILRARLFVRPRRVGWYLTAGILLLAAVIERHWPELPAPEWRPFFAHWSATIGELRSVGLTNPVWWQWIGLFFLATPILVFFALRRKLIEPAFAVLLGLLFLLTIWQARWSYFLGIVLVVMLPALFEVVRRRSLGNLFLALALLPIFSAWDETFWPNEQMAARQAEARAEAAEWRAAASIIPRGQVAPFLAPWWLSPEMAYWSRQPGVAGSSHESLRGIVDSARFFLALVPNDAEAILRRDGVKWVFAYDGDRVAENSAAILGVAAPPGALCFILDQTPARAPSFLAFVGQNNSCKIYRVRD
ncbi:MAG TPA: hypothetical protein VHW03_03945 [Chthoniobacterales bacterium]|nr:hypothetical protein [Chthoniobacterales bacterium]